MSDELTRIDDAFARQQAAEAVSFLRQYFQRNPTLAAARAVTERLEKHDAPADRRRCKAFFLRSFTLEPMLPLLRAWALLHGVDLQPQVGEFNAYPQELLDPGSALYTSEPDVVFLAVQTRDLLPDLWERSAGLGAAQTQALVEQALANLQSWVGLFRERSRAHLVLFDLALPGWPSAGLLDAQSPDGQSGKILWLNQQLRALAAAHTGVTVLPFEALVARIGRERFYDERKWLTARMPVAAGALWPLACECTRMLLLLMGKVCKALVVDLDNTLWGGIVGEDGPHGIKIGAEYPGAAFRAFQRAILDLYERGVILAVASKNNPADAMEVIEKHPGMLLRPQHFSSLQISWTEKAQSLRAIAAELNIGIDAVAFVDDNPVEREHVRISVPEVYVIDLPTDAMGYAEALRSVPVFERTVLTSEDRARGALYAAERARTSLEKASGSVEEFYRSLEMSMTIGSATPGAVARIAQLTQKTNQFNLTTRRYDEQQIVDFAGRPEMGVYSCAVKDKFGDNGLVGVAITKQEGAVWEIDTFLLSCRVIGRTVETAFLAHLAEQARAAGARTLRGWYLPTKKNPPAKDFYSRHQFTAISETESGVLWEMDLAKGQITCPPWITMTVAQGAD
ncbi:MAG TPA: HAD-IIIC family phosphatase [Polyangia bacterium]|nr:HAD-IIIC family phosphatase [Polyangia bacterium]